MIIEDGERLILVSENEKVKTLMRKIDSSACINMPLEPLPKSENSNNQKPQTAFDYSGLVKQKGIRGVMEIYSLLPYFPESEDKTRLTAFVKQMIKKYLSVVVRENAPSATKVRRLHKELSPFVIPSEKAVYSSLKGKHLTQDDVDILYKQLVNHLVQRVK